MPCSTRTCPAWVDVVLESPQFWSPIHKHRCPFWRKAILLLISFSVHVTHVDTHLVRIAAYACDTLQSKVKGRQPVFAFGISVCESGWLEEGYDEASQATVDVQPEIVFLRQFSECRNVILRPVWVVDARAHELQ